ncbi:hypothetical protein GHT06_014865 [Daphnia sinensis]|uniref:Uncharacterized protein n=1 Tax=Daphnia sinensis TaxID=1820382 RepID=A0AAD5KSH2_9CRUS|nr:hypothetical protein GHT06_014865 [Daphnia sinensis]
MARTKPRSRKSAGSKASPKQLVENATTEGAPENTSDNGNSADDVIVKEKEENVVGEAKANDLTATTGAKAVKRPQPVKNSAKAQKKPKVEEDDEEENEEEEAIKSEKSSPKPLSKNQKKKMKKAQQQSQKLGVPAQVQKKKASLPAASKPKTQQPNKKTKS